MKNRYGTLLAAIAATALACGGESQRADFKQKVIVETSSAIVIGDVATVEISGTGAVVGAVGPFTLTYDATKGTFKGTLYLTPDTYSFTLTAKKADGTTVIGTATTTGVVVSATAVANIAINIASILEALPTQGFVITGFTFTGYADVSAAAPFSVSVAFAGTSPTFAWTAKKVSSPSTNCAGSFSPDAVSASVSFTGTAADICTITVTVADAVNTNIKATRSATLGVGLNTSITGQFIPSPTITRIDLLSNGGYDGTWNSTPGTGGLYYPKRPFTNANCTALRSGQTGNPPNVIYANQTCPGTYKTNSGIELPLPTWDGVGTAPVITLTSPQFTIGVAYDLGGIYNASNPPKAGVTVSCPNATSNGVALYSFDNVPANPIAGSGPGSATCPAAPAVCMGSTTLSWTLPIAFTAPAVGDLCTVTVKVDNQGSIDTFPVKVWIYQ